MSAIFGGIILLMVAFVLIFYVVEGIILTKLNKAMYGKGTALAWIPLVKIYLLGKLTINETAGYVMLAVNIVNLFLPEDISELISSVYGPLEFALFVYAFIKSFNVKKSDTVVSVGVNDNMNGYQNIHNDYHQPVNTIDQSNQQIYEQNQMVEQVYQNQNIVSNYQPVNQVMPQNVNTFQNMQNNPQGYQQQIQNAIPTYNQPVQRQVQNQVNESNVVNNIDSMNNNSNM